MKKNSILFLVFVTLFLSSCFKKPEFAGVEKFKLVSQTDTSIVASMFVKVNNPNSFSIQTNSINYKAFINNVQVGQGNSVEQFVLNENQITSFENKVELNIVKLISVYDFIINKDSFPMDIEFVGNFTKVKANITKRQTVYIAPNEIIAKIFNANYFKNILSVSKFELKNMGIKTTELSVKAELTNNFPIEISVNKMNLNLYSDDKATTALGTANLKNPIVLKQNNTQTLDISAIINNSNVTANLMSKIMSGNIKFYLKGEIFMKVKDKEFNFPYNSWITL